jgi:hypothetical protein
MSAKKAFKSPARKNDRWEGMARRSREWYASPGRRVPREHGRDRLCDEREQGSPARVEEQRLLVDQQVLIEAEGAARDLDRRVDAIEAGPDLLDARSAGGIRHGHGFLLEPEGTEKQS